MEEYIKMCSQYGLQAGMTNEEMKEHCTKLFPTLKRWKNNWTIKKTCFTCFYYGIIKKNRGMYNVFSSFLFYENIITDNSYNFTSFFNRIIYL